MSEPDPSDVSADAAALPGYERGETKKAMHLMRAAAWPERRLVLHTFFWLMLAAALDALGPLLSRRFIDVYLVPHQVDRFGIVVLLGGCLAVGWGASMVRYVQLVRLSGVAMRSVKRLREQVFSHVLQLPIRYFDQAIIGKLVSRVTNDTEQVKNLYVQVLFVMLDSLITVVGIMAAMAWLDVRLMAIVSILVPAVVVIVWFYQKMSAPAVALARELRSEINSQMAESIAGMQVLQATNAEASFEARFSNTNERHYQARLGELRINAWLLRPMLDLLNVALLATVLFTFSLRPLSVVEVGVLYAFVSYIARVVDPLIQITMQFSQLQQATIAAARVNNLLREPTRIAYLGNQVVAEGRLRFEDVYFGYDPARPVLHGINLDIPAGQFIGIVGHTGSGKSTLLGLLLRFYTAQTGRIRVDDVALEDISDSSFRRDVGVVPQEPFLLAASAAENISLGYPLDQSEIELAARAARCHDFIENLERGYQTPLGEGGMRLSVGQKQLIAIARALARKPRVLLLDEATAHIDSETEQIVQEALTSLAGHVTVVAIAHRLSTIRAADKIVVLNHGKIAETGKHDELMQIEAGIYQHLYLLQQIGSEADENVLV